MTLVWATFTSWFFGPSLFDRFGTATGAECVIIVPFRSGTPSPNVRNDEFVLILRIGPEALGTPGIDGLVGGPENGVLLSVPLEYCHTRTTITADTHAELLTQSFLQSPSALSSGFKEGLEESWKQAVQSWKGGRAKLYKGHDVSGHIFLLTLCITFLTDQVIGVLYPSGTYPG